MASGREDDPGDYLLDWDEQTALLILQLQLEDISDGDRECDEWTSVAIAARYCITFFVFSVFPAPDSPLQVCQVVDQEHY